jgi:NADH:ubiquinone oxidoreductase subunit 6 (subunit J)
VLVPGLITVLMVFAITMVGNENEQRGKQRLPLLLTIASILLLALLTVPLIPAAEATAQLPQSEVLWQERELDLVLQVVLGVIGLTRKTSNSSCSTMLANVHFALNVW